MCRNKRLLTPSGKHFRKLKRRLCTPVLISSGTSFADCSEKLDHNVASWLGAEIAFAVHPDADGVAFHVAFSDHKHGMHFQLFGALDLRGI